MLRLKVFAIILLIMASIANICAAEEDSFSMDSVEQQNCDSLTKMAIDSKDNNLKNYIVRYDLTDDYEARNEGNEMCFYFLSKLLARIEIYKQVAKQQEEASALRNKRVRNKPRKNLLKPPFYFKY